jgi:heme-degrading monooxygenase HmoA
VTTPAEPAPIARTPEPPYYAVIFTSTRHATDAEGYARMAEAMAALAAAQPGFLGMESVRAPDGNGITVSYWESEAAIRAWKAVAAHREAQRRGRAVWYADYTLRVARVERAYTKGTSRAAGLDERR